MKFFFKILFLSFFFARTVLATEAIDLNAAAPESPAKIRVPHSARTKDNIMDSMVDFLLVKLLARYEKMGIYISYSFFEINSKRQFEFKDFTFVLKRNDAKGEIKLPKMVIGFSEFIEGLKSKQFMLTRLELTNPSADIDVIEKTKTRKLKVAAETAVFNDFRLFSLDSTEVHRNGEPITTVGAIQATKAAMVVTNPTEKYRVYETEIKGLSLRSLRFSQMTFTSATANGKSFKTVPEFLNEIKM